MSGRDRDRDRDRDRYRESDRGDRDDRRRDDRRDDRREDRRDDRRGDDRRRDDARREDKRKEERKEKEARPYGDDGEDHRLTKKRSMSDRYREEGEIDVPSSSSGAALATPAVPVELDEYGRPIKKKLTKEERQAAALARIEEQKRDPKKMREHQLEKANELVETGIHWSRKKLGAMNQRDWNICKEDFKIKVKSGGNCNPLRNWEESDLPQRLLDAIALAGYKDPSPIQRMCVPLGMTNRDVIGIAETGSGKTAAFVIPMIVYILSKPESQCGEGPIACILAPTRELANQILHEAQRFSAPFAFKCFGIVGGGGIQSIESQSFNMSQGIQILVATPGRLIDQLENRRVVLNQCDYVVLDEADRMIDMGFEPQVQQILDCIPAKNLKPDTDETEEGNLDFLYRQTFMFSATFPPAVQRLAQKYLRRPAIVTVGDVGKTADTVEQRIEYTKENQKTTLLLNLLRSGPRPPIIVFVNAKSQADAVCRALIQEHWKAATLHSGKAQDQREAALEGFKSGKYEVLVSTDIAARGIDVSGISHVIQYDAPKSIEDYTHRIGRTGRAGKSGIATLLLTEDNVHLFFELKELFTKIGAKVPHELFMHPASKEPFTGTIGKSGKDGDGGGGRGGGGGVPTGPGGVSYSQWKRQQYEAAAKTSAGGGGF